MRKQKLFATILLGCLVLTSCSSTIDPNTGERRDTLEGFNRKMWDFNYHVADPYVLKPLAKGWTHVPSPLRHGIINVADNLDEPASFANRLVQGKFKQALIHFNRFWINSIFGLGGLIDVASYSNPLKKQDDSRFGDTLGRYGVGTGPYIMLPAYGAFTPRQDVGNLVDTTYPMLALLGPWTLLKAGIQAVDTRANLMDKEALLEQAQDPYVTFREAYFQNLEQRIGDNNKKEEPVLSQDILNQID